jgi:hypothetical protein
MLLKNTSRFTIRPPAAHAFGGFFALAIHPTGTYQ